MAQKANRASAPEIYIANKTFLTDGNQWVRQGDTVAAGHPLLKGRIQSGNYFRPFTPTFGPVEPEPEAEPEPTPEPEPVEPTSEQPTGLEAYAALQARAKDLGLPATGKSVELEAAIKAEEDRLTVSGGSA